MTSAIRRYSEMASDVLEATRRSRAGRKGVLVLGMHRSGTSAITGLVSLLGPSLGDQHDLLPADEANRKGYWESRRLTEFQESLLEKLGGDWAAPPPLEPGWEQDWRLVRRVGLARRIFREIYGADEQWLWKDPRSTLLLPFWRRALRVEPIVVGIFRDPMEVAGSLARRDGMPKREALGLWETYNRALLVNIRGLPALIAGYEDLLNDPLPVARELADFFQAQGFRVSLPDEDVLRECIDPELRHSVPQAAGTTPDEDVSTAQRELLEALLRARGSYSEFGVSRNGAARPA